MHPRSGLVRKKRLKLVVARMALQIVVKDRRCLKSGISGQKSWVQCSVADCTSVHDDGYKKRDKTGVGEICAGL